MDPSPKQVSKHNQVPVDVDNFSFKNYLKWLIMHGQDEPLREPNFVFSKLILLSFIFAFSMFITIPIRAYYDYEDPLLKDKDDSLEGVSAENTLRRLKYKKKTANWQNYPV